MSETFCSKPRGLFDLLCVLKYNLYVIVSFGIHLLKYLRIPYIHIISASEILPYVIDPLSHHSVVETLFLPDVYEFWPETPPINAASSVAYSMSHFVS